MAGEGRFGGREEKPGLKIALLSAANSIHTVRWANALCARGHEVALFSLACHRAPAGAYDRHVRLIPLGGGGALDYWRCAAPLREALAALHPDILNAHYATGYGTLARLCGFRPLLLSVWGSDVYDFPKGGPVHRLILSRNLGAATAIASTSRAMAAQVRRVWPCEKPVYITPFGVDPSQFTPDEDETPFPGRFTVGTVRALEPKYGLPVLLHAFALMKSRLGREGTLPPGGLRLEIYGAGSQKKALEKLIRALGLSDEAALHGVIPHARVPGVLRTFDVFCAPSVLDSESFGVAAVEAMACGVPVVVSDADGLREVTVDGRTGFVVPKHDPVLLCNRLVTLAMDPALRGRLGRAGRDHVLKCYAWEDCVRAMEDALTDTLMNERRRRAQREVPG